MAANVRSSSYFYRQDNYTTVAAASVATKTPLVPIDYLLIYNTDAANSASLSFDGGNTFFTLKAGVQLQLFPSKMISYMVKDTVDNSHAALQCIYGSES